MGEDLISKQMAIDAVYKCTDYYVGNLPIMIDKADAYKALADLPAADTFLRWIPCSERLPQSGSVLCCDHHGEIMIGYPYEDEESNTGFSAEYDDCFMIDCVAWMPLPEPYKEENDGTAD